MNRTTTTTMTTTAKEPKHLHLVGVTMKKPDQAPQLFLPCHFPISASLQAYWERGMEGAPYGYLLSPVLCSVSMLTLAIFHFKAPSDVHYRAIHLPGLASFFVALSFRLSENGGSREGGCLASWTRK